MDLRLFDNCRKVVDGCDHAFHLAADMGGMGEWGGGCLGGMCGQGGV